jgi:hypothetical protein
MYGDCGDSLFRAQRQCTGEQDEGELSVRVRLGGAYVSGTGEDVGVEDAFTVHGRGDGHDAGGGRVQSAAQQAREHVMRQVIDLQGGVEPSDVGPAWRNRFNGCNRPSGGTLTAFIRRSR